MSSTYEENEAYMQGVASRDAEVKELLELKESCRKHKIEFTHQITQLEFEVARLTAALESLPVAQGVDRRKLLSELDAHPNRAGQSWAIDIREGRFDAPKDERWEKLKEIIQSNVGLANSPENFIRLWVLGKMSELEAADRANGDAEATQGGGIEK